MISNKLLKPKNFYIVNYNCNNNQHSNFISGDLCCQDLIFAFILEFVYWEDKYMLLSRVGCRESFADRKKERGFANTLSRLINDKARNMTFSETEMNEFCQHFIQQNSQ